MWRLQKDFSFEAAHHLPYHDGKCRRPHGHSWRGTVVVEGRELEISGPKAGMLIDYGDLSQALKPLVEDFLDHWDLNETTGLESPTSELLAKWVFDRLKSQIPLLVAIIIEETCTARAEYRP